MGRRDTVLDAAIALLGQQGVRALTHRAVDAAAGLPTGSTSNLFRTRDALVDGVVDRFVEREASVWDGVVDRVDGSTPAGLGRALAAFAVEATGPNRTLTLARYAVLLEAAHRPTLRAHLHAEGAGVSGRAAGWLREAGSSRPEQDAHLVLNYWTGLVLHELADPASHFDPEPLVVALVTTVLASGRDEG